VLDTTISKQTQVRHAFSYKQLEVKKKHRFYAEIVTDITTRNVNTHNRTTQHGPHQQKSVVNSGAREGWAVLAFYKTVNVLALVVNSVFSVASLLSISRYLFVLLRLCPPFEYCSVFTSLAVCFFFNSSIICIDSFVSVCCASLLESYWFLVLQFVVPAFQRVIGSWSFTLVAVPRRLSKTSFFSDLLHNQLVWCSHLWVVHSPVCVTKDLFCSVVIMGDKLLVEHVQWNLVHLYSQFVTRISESFSSWSLLSGRDNHVDLQLGICT